MGSIFSDDFKTMTIKETPTSEWWSVCCSRYPVTELNPNFTVKIIGQNIRAWRIGLGMMENPMRDVYCQFYSHGGIWSHSYASERAKPYAEWTDYAEWNEYANNDHTDD